MAILEIAGNPQIGERKKGDLKEFMVYKFKVQQLLLLIAYRVNSKKEIELVDLGSHQNFYRNLRNSRES